MRRTLRKCVLTCVLSLLAGALGVPVAWAQDPGTAGPLAVTVQQYDYGDTAFTPTGFPGPVELRAEVYRPTNLSGGPFPLVIFLHGRHITCTSGLQWPCTGGATPIPSHQGYAYIGNILASHGYIVVSISANGINARDNSVFDLGAQARAELIQRHLDQWNTFNTSGAAPFGTTFVGRVDLDNVGTMGHSRGGEGVMRHYLYNQSLGSPYNIRAVFPLAPVDFNRPIINNVPFQVLLPYCDGDVSDLQGVHFYDDARYSDPGDLAPKHTLLVMGANHNFYNTVWTSGFVGAGDDWGGVIGDTHCDQGRPRRLTASEQRGTGLAYITGFFRRYLGGETQFDPMLKGDVPAPPSATTNDLLLSYHAPDSPTERRDVNRVLVASNLTTNTLGGAVTTSGFTPNDLCGGTFPDSVCLPGQANFRQPHTTPSARSSMPGMVQLRGGWSSGSANYTNNLPAGTRDVSGFLALQFRAGVNFDDPRNTGVPVNFTVRLTDGTGAFADTTVGAHSDALFYPPGSFVGEVPKVVLNTVRIPLSAFGGINLSDVRSIQFRFNQTSSGALLITDLAFADSGTPPSFPDLVETTITNPPATVLQGGSFSVTDTVQNQGSVGAGASTTRYYLSPDTTKGAGDTLLTGTRSVPALAAGATSNGSQNVTVPGGTSVGTYFLIACADDTGVVPESHEGNNCRASAGTVQVQSSGGGGPDLVESAVTNPPASVGLGQSFSVTDTVTNQGGATAAASSTRYYLSLDTTKSSKDKLLGGVRSVPSLGPGAASTGSRTVKVKTSTAPGTYFLLACADDKKVVAEDDETNNCRASATTVVVVAADLVETSITNPPASRAVGQTFSITDTVQNQGNLAAGASTTRYYLSLNTKKSSGDIPFSATRAVGALAAGASSSGSVTVTVPAGTPAAAYFVLACADDTKAITEASEKNNCRASASQVTITP